MQDSPALAHGWPDLIPLREELGGAPFFITHTGGEDPIGGGGMNAGGAARGGRIRRAMLPFMLGVAAMLVVGIVLFWSGAFPLFAVYMEVPEPDMDSDSTVIPVKIIEMPADSLTKDAVYVGSLTFVGLVMFGSTMLVRAFYINKLDTRKQNIGAGLVIGGTWFLAGTHIMFAFTYNSPTHDGLVPLLSVALAGTILMGGALVASKSRVGV